MRFVTSLNILENIPLASYTTLGIGGSARYFVSAESESMMQDALAWATQHGFSSFVLGGGSNLIVSDTGYNGLVIQTALKGSHAPNLYLTSHPVPEERVHITVGAGEDWDAFVLQCVRENLQGIECLAGIPGRVGATPVQNVGAYGQEVAETILRVRALDRTTGEIRTLPSSDCGFAYRRSRFNHDEPGRWVILSVTFVLKPNGPPALKYADLKNYFADAAEPPRLIDVYNAVREIRSRKGMVVRHDDPDSRSAGSFFKNPTVTMAESERIMAQAGGDIPHWPQENGVLKLSAAWLIERAGFRRGEAFGNVGISSKHVLALINRGSGTAAELTALARRIQDGVIQTWGVTLSPEPVFLGFGPENTLPLHVVRAG